MVWAYEYKYKGDKYEIQHGGSAGDARARGGNERE
jgi:hypothetical protein